ncbi:MAG: hypothetical protein LBQ18_00135 [Campylobacteraceae bacterium]|jgi:transcriptional regulator NrdR family protein|nr:hypothetical protein [Campylobacteraceae bacterium]
MALACPKCLGETEVSCTNSSPAFVERWRKCKECNYSFQTVEFIKVDMALLEYANDIVEAYKGYFYKEPKQKGKG